MVGPSFPGRDQLKGFKGVLLDLDNTLYSYPESHEAGLVSAFEVVSSFFARREDFLSSYDAARERVAVDGRTTGASHSRTLYFQKLLEARLGKTEVGLTKRVAAEYWRAFSAAASVPPSAVQFLKLCQNLSLKICLLTDLTAEVQFDKLLALGLDAYLDFVVTSEEAGVEKPHPYAFYLALEKLKLGAQDVMMIGDDKGKDGKGARLLGMPFHLVTWGDEC